MVARRNHSMFNQHEKYDIVVLGKSSGFWEKMFINSYLFNSFSIQHYVIQFVSDLRQSRFFPPVSSTNKPDRHESWKWRWTTPSKQEVNCSIISLWKSSTTKSLVIC